MPETSLGKPKTKPKRGKANRKSPPGEEAAAGESSVQDLVAALGDEAPEPQSRAPGIAADRAEEGEAESQPLDEPRDADAAELEGLEAFHDHALGLVSDLPMEPDDDLSEIDGDAPRPLMAIVESLLFAATKPMSVRDLRRILKEPSVRQIQLALKHLMAETAERGVVLGQVAGGFRLRTHPGNARWVQQMLAGKPVRLSRSQLEALAVIAYRQPLTKAEIDHVRGVDCSAVLKLLLDRDLAKIVGRKEEPGRPHLYGTSVKFLEFFNLRSLRDMPDLHEFRELTEDSQVTLRERLGDDEADLTLEQEVMGQEVLHFDDRGSLEADSREPTDASDSLPSDEPEATPSELDSVPAADIVSPEEEESQS